MTKPIGRTIRFDYEPPRRDRGEIEEDFDLAYEKGDLCAATDLFRELVSHDVFEALSTYPAPATGTLIL